MAVEADYAKLVEKKQQLDKLSRAGNAEAKAEKARIGEDIRNIEREQNRAGKPISATMRGDKAVVTVGDAPSKRSLQEEYCRKFDAEKVVNIGGREQTLRQYHERRLLKK